MKKLNSARFKHTVHSKVGVNGAVVIEPVEVVLKKEGEAAHLILVRAPISKKELVIFINVHIGEIGLMVLVHNLVVLELKLFHEIVTITKEKLLLRIVRKKIPLNKRKNMSSAQWKLIAHGLFGVHGTSVTNPVVVELKKDGESVHHIHVMALMLNNVFVIHKDVYRNGPRGLVLVNARSYGLKYKKSRVH